MLKRPYKLTAQIASSASINEQDTLAIKSALVKTGDYKIPDYGITPYADESMIQGIRKFQKKNNLKTDGIMNPGGETEQALFGNSQTKPTLRKDIKTKRNERRKKLNALVAKKPKQDDKKEVNMTDCFPSNDDKPWWHLPPIKTEQPNKAKREHDSGINIAKKLPDISEIADDVSLAMNEAYDMDGGKQDGEFQKQVSDFTGLMQILHETDSKEANKYANRLFQNLKPEARTILMAQATPRSTPQNTPPTEGEIKLVQNETHAGPKPEEANKPEDDFSPILQGNIEIRNDGRGYGHYGADRTGKDGERREHEGIDLVVTEGQEVFSPIDGVVVRRAYPYGSNLGEGANNGLLIRDEKGYHYKIFYMAPPDGLKKGDRIKKNQVLGTAADVSVNHNKKDTPEDKRMKPHIHIEVINPDGQHIDPTPIFFPDIKE